MFDLLMFGRTLSSRCRVGIYVDRLVLAALFKRVVPRKCKAMELLGGIVKIVSMELDSQ